MTDIRIKYSVASGAYPALLPGEPAYTEALPGQFALGTNAANEVFVSFGTAASTKLANIEANATADQTGAEIKAAYEGETNTNAFTDAEKTKLGGLDDNHFKGTHLNLAALNTAHPTAVAGDYADVDAGAGNDVQRYIWDVDDTAWVAQSGDVGGETAASIKTKYESNADTNAYEDAEKAKLANIEANATADQTGAEIATLISVLADTNLLTDAQLALVTNAVQVNTHIGQTDTPGAYGGANFLVAVNPANNALVHVDSIDGGSF